MVRTERGGMMTKTQKLLLGNLVYFGIAALYNKDTSAEMLYFIIFMASFVVYTLLCVVEKDKP
jgi:hypothetical protein